MDTRDRRSNRILTRFFAALLLCCTLPWIAGAQTTTVSGTVTDTNGIPYSGGQIKAQLVLAGAGVTGQPTVTVNNAQQCRSAGQGSAPCQVPFPGTQGPLALDNTGSFTISLQDNTLVTPASTQWLFTVTTQGSPPPTGTGPQTCSATLSISGASQSVTSSFTGCPALSRVAGSGGTKVYTSQFATGGVKYTYSANYTNASNVISTSTGDVSCNPFADPGKLALLTQFSSNATIAPYTQNLAVPYGTTVTGCTPNGGFVLSATPTLTCTPTTNISCGFAYGKQVDDVGLDSAAIAAWGTPGQCKLLEINDVYFFSVASNHFWNSTIAQLSSACGGQFGGANVSGIDSTQEGPMLAGSGAALPLIPYNFNFVSCPSNASCLFSTPNLFGDKIGINGLGQPATGVSTNQTMAVFQGSTGGAACTGSTLKNSGFANWGVNSSAQSTIGVSLGVNACGNPEYDNNVIEMFFATPCQLNGGGGITINTNYFYNMCYGATVQAAILNPANGTMNLKGNFFSNLTAPGPVVSYGASSGGQINSDSNSYGGSLSLTNPTDLFLNGTGTLSFNSTNDTFSLNPAGSTGTAIAILGNNTTFTFKGIRVTATGTNNRAFNVAANNTLINDGGFNIINNGTLANIFNGTTIARPSETQTGTCAANAATVTFKLAYINAPNVSVSVTTSGSTGAQATSTTTTTATIHCNGATDSFVATVYPNPI